MSMTPPHLITRWGGFLRYLRGSASRRLGQRPAQFLVDLH